jgi:hypothetical protein
MKAIFFFTCVAIVIGCGVVYAMTPSKAEVNRAQAIKECVQKSGFANDKKMRHIMEYSCTKEIK